jgi:hypothetical protein
MNIYGISGLAGSGKDSVADALENARFTKVSLADPMKRAAMDWFGWSQDILWGPSEKRSIEDPRAPGLTARKVLQLMGTELGRACYQDIWVDYAMRTAKELLKDAPPDPYIAKPFTRQAYDPCRGVDKCHWISDRIGVVIPDCRFKNEIVAIKEREGKVIRIKRPGYDKPKWDHPSETEQLEIPDEAFDYIFHNDGTLDDIPAKVNQMIQALDKGQVDELQHIALRNSEV